MAQPQVVDPRAEVMAASRRRSGSSVLLEAMEQQQQQPQHQQQQQQPTTSSVLSNNNASDGSYPTVEENGGVADGGTHPSHFFSLRNRFEEKDGSASGRGGGGGGKSYGPSVRGLKERFQFQNASGKNNDVNVGEVMGSNHSSISSSSLQSAHHSRSPRHGASSGSNSINNNSSSNRNSRELTMGSDAAPALDPRRRLSGGGSGAPLSPTRSGAPPLSPTPSVELQNQSSPTHSSSAPYAEVKLRRTTLEGTKSNSSSTDSGLSLPDSIREPTSHVQRFNLTRALFARMEEENRQKIEKERTGGSSASKRKSSASPTYTQHAKPLLSPTTVSPAHLDSSWKQNNLSKDTRQTQSTSDVREFSSSSSSSLLPTSSSGLYSDSLGKTEALSDNCLDRATDKVFKSTQKFEREENVIEPKRARTNSNNSIGSGSGDGHGREVVEDIVMADSYVNAQAPPTSSLSSSLSSSLHSTQGKPLKDDSSETSLSSSLSSSSPSSITMRPKSHGMSQQRTPDGAEKESTGQTTANKRLSREDIEKALEKADSYLANLGSPDDVKKNDGEMQERINRRRSPEQNHSESAALARMRFLYGEEAARDASSRKKPKDVSESNDVMGNNEINEVEEAMEVSQAEVQNASLPGASLKVGTALSADLLPTSSASSSMSSLLSSSNDALCDPSSVPAGTTPDLPPPSYHEITEPPSYHEATSPSSIRMSQKVIQQQQQKQSNENPILKKPTIPSRPPLPVPRRAAPLPPKTPPPSSRSGGTSGSSANDSGTCTDHPGAPPPPSRGVSGIDTAGNRQGMYLDDDLIIPEEQMKHQDEEAENNGDTPPPVSSLQSSTDPVTRDPGDGKEDGDVSDGEPLEIDYKNLSYIEIPPIASENEDEEEDSSGDEVDYHKPTMVSFSKNPIRVFATYSIADYDRRNEDVDPVAASAEYELEKRVEKMDVFPVDLVKGSEGLGLSIIGMGVGADAGLEKLGIFIKTLTPGGAAQRSAMIQVNDQIIEVDGKSLVGVTQAYAASVLRNTSGHVKFMIGREKDPSKSEVARLIQQSLDQDKRREAMKEKDQQMRQLEDSFQPRDEVLPEKKQQQQQQQQHLPVNGHKVDKTIEDLKEDDNPLNSESTDSPRDGPSPMSESEQQYILDEDEDSRRDGGNTSATSTDEDLVDKEDGTPTSPAPSYSHELDAALIVELKEIQNKLSTSQDEVSKLKSKVSQLETTEAQRKATEKKFDDLSRKYTEREKVFDAMKKELSSYKDMMVASQSQHIELERKVRELGALEKKYHKAKKLIKDYQQREKDFIQERESLLEQQAEKDQQYNSLVKSLKDKIFTLEKEVTDARQVAGLPDSPPASSDSLDLSVTSVAAVAMATPLSSTSTTTSRVTDAAPNRKLDESLSPLTQSTEDILENSIGSEISDIANTPDVEDAPMTETITMEHISQVQQSAPPLSSPSPLPTPQDDGTSCDLKTEDFIMKEEEDFYSVPPPAKSVAKSDFDSIVNQSSPLLDSTPIRDRAQLGGHANRRPPSKKLLMGQDSGSMASSSIDQEDTSSIHSETDDGGDGMMMMDESGLDMWNKHDSDSTVKKSLLKKRKPPPQPPCPSDLSTESSSTTTTTTTTTTTVVATTTTPANVITTTTTNSRTTSSIPPPPPPKPKNLPLKVPPKPAISSASPSPISDTTTKATSASSTTATPSPSSSVLLSSTTSSPLPKAKSNHDSISTTDNNNKTTGAVPGSRNSGQNIGGGVSSGVPHLPLRKDDSASDTSSSYSQSSYDPNNPQFKGGHSQIPESVAPDADDDNSAGEGGVTLVSAKPTKGFHLPKFPWKSLSSKSGGASSEGGVVLLSSRTKDGYSPSGGDDSGITLLSRKIIPTGYEDTDASSVGSGDVSTVMMVTEPEMLGAAGKYSFNNEDGNKGTTPGTFTSSSPTFVCDWGTDKVCQWLSELDMGKYSAAFSEKQVDGNQLCALDSSRLKALGVTSSKDKELIKKKIKELKASMERGKKQLEKERKQREKEQKKMSKKK